MRTKSTNQQESLIIEVIDRHVMSPDREVQQVLAKYVRAADQLDGNAISRLFTREGKIEVYYVNMVSCETLFVLTGQQAIAEGIMDLIKAPSAPGFSHHTTSDLIISIDGNYATVDAQFVRFNVVAHQCPESGWPPDMVGSTGSITTTEAGYYQPRLKKVDGTWKIVQMRVLHYLPIVMPAR